MWICSFYWTFCFFSLLMLLLQLQWPRKHTEHLYLHLDHFMSRGSKVEMESKPGVTKTTKQKVPAPLKKHGGSSDMFGPWCLYYRGAGIFCISSVCSGLSACCWGHREKFCLIAAECQRHCVEQLLSSEYSPSCSTSNITCDARWTRGDDAQDSPNRRYTRNFGFTVEFFFELRVWPHSFRTHVNQDLSSDNK